MKGTGIRSIRKRNGRVETDKRKKNMLVKCFEKERCGKNQVNKIIIITSIITCI